MVLRLSPPKAHGATHFGGFTTNGSEGLLRLQFHLKGEFFMAMVLRGALYAAAGGVLFVAAQTATAQPVNGCPAGQAMRASNPSGRNVRCVPIPRRKRC